MLKLDNPITRGISTWSKTKDGNRGSLEERRMDLFLKNYLVKTFFGSPTPIKADEIPYCNPNDY